MRRLLILSICVVFCVSCIHTRDIQKEISDELQPAKLRYAFNTQIVDLGSKSQCPDRNINIVNDETDSSEFNMLKSRGKYMVTRYYFSNQIVAYLKDAYRQSRIQFESHSTKSINISVQNIEGWYSHSCGTIIKMTVRIPERNVTIPFTSTQSAMDVHWAAAYAIHDISWQIVNDPTIQDYILCR